MGQTIDTAVIRPDPLTRSVQDAVRTIDENALRPVARRDAGLAYQPRILLALLTYCYAREIYGSEEVEGLLRRDVEFRRLCQNEFPGARIFRRFRRENRDALLRCLRMVLCFLAGQRRARGVAAEWREGQEEEEAGRRIDLAVVMDCIELDGD
jgi:transposase